MRSSSTLQTADRALQILQQFQQTGEVLTVGELASRLSLHRSTASRLVSTLRARGFLEGAPGEAVRLGPEAVRIGRLALAGRQLIIIAQPVMDRLAKETGEAVTLAMPSGEQVQGDLVHMDDFSVGIRDSSGWYHSYPRDNVRVELDDPLETHRALLRRITQKEFHDLFAYLESLK